MTKYDIRGTIMMFFGAGFVVAGAPIVNPPDGDEHSDLPQLFTDYLFKPVSIVCGLIIAGMGTAAYMTTLKHKSGSSSRSNIPVACNTFLSGIYSGLTVTFFRAMTLLSKNALGNDRSEDLLRFKFWMFVFFAFATGGAMIYCLNLALRYGEARIVVPINIAFSLVFQVSLGLFYWQEYDSFEKDIWIVYFCIGVFLSVLSALYPSIAREHFEKLESKRKMLMPMSPTSKKSLGLSLTTENVRYQYVDQFRILDMNVEMPKGIQYLNRPSYSCE